MHIAAKLLQYKRAVENGFLSTRISAAAKSCRESIFHSPYSYLPPCKALGRLLTHLFVQHILPGHAVAEPDPIFRKVKYHPVLSHFPGVNAQHHRLTVSAAN